jgi:hypothetical protein
LKYAEGVTRRLFDSLLAIERRRIGSRPHTNPEKPPTHLDVMPAARN